MPLAYLSEDERKKIADDDQEREYKQKVQAER
jgi:hypothetical protein